MCNVAIETQTGEFVDLAHQLYFFISLDQISEPRKYSVRISSLMNGQGGLIVADINSKEEARKELLDFLKRGNFVIREYKLNTTNKEK